MGIPQSGATLGNPRAPVTMTYYSDLQCAVCADFTLNSGFGELLAKDVRAGKVKIVYRAFQTAPRDPQTFQAQQAAALAAGKQNHFWDYAELFYLQQGPEGTSYVTGSSYLTDLANPDTGTQHPQVAQHRRRLLADQPGAIRSARRQRGRGAGHADADLRGPELESAGPASVPNSTPNSAPRPPTAHGLHKHGARSYTPSTSASPTQSSAPETIT